MTRVGIKRPQRLSYLHINRQVKEQDTLSHRLSAIRKPSQAHGARKANHR